MVTPPQDADNLAAVQAAFTLITQTVDSARRGPIEFTVWTPLTARQQFLTVGAVLGVVSGLADYARDTGFDVDGWLAGLALDVTTQVSGYPKGTT